jgi:elongator complex protein 2
MDGMNEFIAQSHTGGFYRYERRESSYSLRYAASGHLDEISSLDWRDGLLLTSSLDMTARIYTKRENKWMEVCRPEIHGHPLKAARFLKGEKIELISGGHETILRLFEATRQFLLSNQLEVKNQEEYPPSAVLSELSLTNEMSEDISTDKEANEYFLSAKSVFLEVKRVYGHFFEVEDVCVSDKMLVSCNRSSSKEFSGIFVWNLEFKKTQYIMLHNLGIIRMKFSDDGRFLVASSRDKTVSIYKVKTVEGEYGLELVSQIKDHRRVVWDVAISYDNSFFASCSRDRRLLLYSMKEMKMVAEHEFPCEVTALSFHPSKYELSIGCEDGTLSIARITGDDKIVIESKINCHGSKITCVEYSKLGEYIATGGSDSLLRVFRNKD